MQNCFKKSTLGQKNRQKTNGQNGGKKFDF